MDNQIKKILERGVEEVIEKDHLASRLQDAGKLRVKLGIDPTGSELHLGHTVVLRKLRQFQDAGHQAVLIIGDFTAKIGDPSGRNDSRPELSDEQIKQNLRDYLKQAALVLDVKKTEVRYNSEWFSKKGPTFLMELASKFTVARTLERDDFQKRLKENRDISILEVLYPLLQGYDSVAIEADVELGGTDQKFNLLMGRKVQKRYGLPEQDIVTLSLIEGTDGVKKMSKSIGNYIGLSELAQEKFNKIMSIPDDLMVKYFTLLTDVPTETIEQLKRDRLNPGLASKSSRKWKGELAFELVKLYHGTKNAQQAKNEFTKVFSQGQIPENIPNLAGAGDELIDFLVKHSLAESRSEAKRLIEQGGVKLNGVVVKSWETKLAAGNVLKIGSHRFARVE